MKPTLLVIAPGSNIYHDCVFTLLVAETGESLATHICSQSGFAPYDLYYDRPERIDEYKKRFGEVEIKFLDETDITQDDMVERNQKWYDSLPHKVKP